jgi:hypothetical protein
MVREGDGHVHSLNLRLLMIPESRDSLNETYIQHTYIHSKL